MLKERPEYVVTTSEFNDVKARLAMLHNKRKSRPQGSRTVRSCGKAPGSGTTTTDGGSDYQRQRRRSSDAEAPSGFESAVNLSSPLVQ